MTNYLVDYSLKIVGQAVENEFSPAGMDSGTIVECADSVDVSILIDFKAMLQQAMCQQGDIVLDASNIERVDGAAIQLLAAFIKDSEKTGIRLIWRNPSSQMLRAAELTGMTDVLKLTKYRQDNL